MKIEADKSIIWNEAAKAGLWLGLFTGAIILVNALFTYLLGSSFGARLAGTLINLALWLRMPLAVQIFHAQIRHKLFWHNE